MLVGPTVAIPFPYRYQRDTEKYAGSTRLVRSGENRMAIDGYVAGLPFPNLRRQDPDAVYKLIYDMYFRYHPAILVYHQRALFFDTYLNRTPTVATAVEFRLGHISDEGFPLSEPLAPSDVFFTSNVTVEAPEQSKYTVNLQIYYDDPNRIQDIYTYIPSLRRSIRRSSAARCSPMVAADILQDDIYARPILYDQFSYRLLGRKKVLQQAHLDLRHMFDEESFNFGGVPGWPKPLMGPWEVRSVWLIDETTLPSNSDYCYGRRITYVDGGTLIPLETDIYDQGGRLWKVLIYSVSPAPIEDGHESVSALANARVLMVDLLSSHATVSSQVQPGQVNEQVPVKYRDVQMWALPAGLSQASR